MARTFDVTYESLDLEVAAPGVLFGWPERPIRFALSGHAPAVLMVSSALFVSSERPRRWRSTPTSGMSP